MENITRVQMEQSLKLVIAKNFYYNDCQKSNGQGGEKEPLCDSAKQKEREI